MAHPTQEQASLDRRRSASRDAYIRSPSRTRTYIPHAGNTSTAIGPTASRRNHRSSSRASFLGRPRQRGAYQIGDVAQGHQHYTFTASASAATQRSRSDSRTLRASLDQDDPYSDGFVFTDDDDDDDDAEQDDNDRNRQSKKHVQPRKPYKNASLSPPPRRPASSPHRDTSSHSPSSHPSVPRHSASPLPPPVDPPSSATTAKGDIEEQYGAEDKPPSRLSRIPYPLAHFLGYRTQATANRALLRPLERLPRKLETLIWAWIGAMIGLGFVMILFSCWDKFSMSDNRPTTSWTAPIIVGSFGASSVILYGTPTSPLGQPKSFVLGQFISALVGCCILKLFQLNANYSPQLIDDSHSLVWVAGGVSVATTLCVMILTDTIHPPGGATALLITTSPPVIRLGWNYLAVILLTSVIMLAWAMLWINLARARYPTYWIEPSNQAVTLASLGLWPRRKLKQQKD